MKQESKINIRKALIVFPIIVVMVGGTFVGAFSVLFDSQREPIHENTVIGDNLEDIVPDEKALKIFDIHENLPNYVDKDIALEGYFITLDKTNKVFGVEYPLGDGDLGMASLTYELSDPNLLKDVTETSLVKASGTMKSFEELHEDDEKGDHKHTLPKFSITSIEIIR